MLCSPAGKAAGAAGAGGQGEAPLTVKAAASGVRGAKGTAVARLDLRGIGSGDAIACGKGAGVIRIIEGSAVGRHDDDEAAIAWLLAA
jgi:hypothetical protein